MRKRPVIITLLVVLLFTLFAVSSISFAFSEVKNQITLSINDFDKNLLQWTKLDFAIGYNLYRTEVPGVYDATPLNEFAITKRSFSDRTTASDKTYYYIVKPIMVDESLGNASNEIATRVNSDVKKTIYLQIKNPKVIVNGISKNIDDAGTEPMILNGRTLTPIRTVVEEVGGILYWDAVNKKMTVTYGGKRIEMWIGKTAFMVNGVLKEMSIAPQLVKGKTFIPIRYITDNLDLAMEWNNETKVITISTVSDMSVASSTPTPDVTAAPEVTVALAPAVTVAPPPAVTVAPTPAVTVAPTPAVTVAPTPAVTVAPPPAVTVVPQPTVAKANITEGVYNIVNKATGGFMNAYSQIATKAPWMLVADKADGSQEQNFNVIRQSDGSYMLVCMNQSYGAGAKITDSSNHLNVGAQFNVANASYPSVQSYHIYDRGNGAYSISLSYSGNPDIAIGLSSTMPYNSPLLELKNYSGAGEQWEFRALSVVSTPPAVTNPAIVNNPVFPLDASAASLYTITYGGDPKYYTNGGEDITATGLHAGTDYRAVDISGNGATEGVPVKAIQDGVVVFRADNYGQLNLKHTVPLTLNDGSKTYNKWFSVYGHMKSIQFNVGAQITKGQIIGYVSSTGSSAVHLHFSITTMLLGDKYVCRYGIGTTDLNVVKQYCNATLSPKWLPGDFANLNVRPFSGDIADSSAAARVNSSTSVAPPSN